MPLSWRCCCCCCCRWSKLKRLAQAQHRAQPHVAVAEQQQAPLPNQQAAQCWQHVAGDIEPSACCQAMQPGWLCPAKRHASTQTPSRPATRDTHPMPTASPWPSRAEPANEQMPNGSCSSFRLLSLRVRRLLRLVGCFGRPPSLLSCCVAIASLAAAASARMPSLSLSSPNNISSDAGRSLGSLGESMPALAASPLRQFKLKRLRVRYVV
ncbi:hypothetical protein AWZ03_014191 [Drosophila navojoa]|uniref:Uncharacterized protein n=1 Tax=Drosophila navojoa TaxID=7232 RepID=A0A484ASF5_DRONA|nr:hypothetical protein AWZ03_014191 [Drosophila navojoa]